MKSQRSKQYKKQRKTKRKYNGGMRPTKEQLSQENQILKNLYERFYNDKSGTAAEVENVFTTLSPYATYKKNKNLLLTFLTEFAGNHYDMNFNKKIIHNLVTRTIAENDPTLVTDDIVFLVIYNLLILQTWSEHKIFNNDIRFILTELPIKNQKLLLNLYKETIAHSNLEVIHILIETHNVLTNEKEYNSLIRYINGCIREHSYYGDVETEDETYHKKIKKIVEKTNPETLRTLNVLYPLHERGIHLPPDVVTELHKYNS